MCSAMDAVPEDIGMRELPWRQQGGTVRTEKAAPSSEETEKLAASVDLLFSRGDALPAVARRNFVRQQADKADAAPDGDIDLELIQRDRVDGSGVWRRCLARRSVSSSPSAASSAFSSSACASFSLCTCSSLPVGSQDRMALAVLSVVSVILGVATSFRAWFW